METPFEILGVDEDAADDTIKAAYLRSVREYPPERNAEAFRRIRDAYELISSEKRRREYRLFHHAQPDLALLLRRAVQPGPPNRPDAAALIGAFTEGLTSVLFGSDERR